MNEKLPKPLGRGPSDLEIFDEIWHLIKSGIILCFLLSGMAFIAGLAWGLIGRFF